MANRTELPDLAVVVQEVAPVDRVVVAGETAARVSSAVLSVALKVRVTGTAVVLTVPVRSAGEGAVGKLGLVVWVITVAAGGTLVVPLMWVARIWMLWVPAGRVTVAEVSVGPAWASGVPSARTSKPEMTAAGVVVVQLTAAVVPVT